MFLNAEARPLPPIARQVDRSLCYIDDRVDWLHGLSPLHSDRLWEAFQDSGYRKWLEPEYPPIDATLPALRRRLHELQITEIEEPEIQALLWEKQREVDRQIELLYLRNTPGLLIASIDLWGDAEHDLVSDADAILRALLDDPADQSADAPQADCYAVYQAARAELDAFHDQDRRFNANIVIDDDLHSKLMVSSGTLHIARNLQVSADQVAALVQHEVGTHVLTRFNGSLQPLGQLEVGLAHYDALQEGLGVLAEYLSGCLAPERMRVIAARVIAAREVCDGVPLVNIFHRLADTFGLPAHDAFDIVLRAGRGGGLTKDVVYLRGVRDLLCYLAGSGSFEFLFIGKFALAQLSSLELLQSSGYVQPPALLPTYLDEPAGRQRLERLRSLSLQEFAIEDQH